MSDPPPKTFKMHLEIESEYPLGLAPQVLRRLMRRTLIRTFIRQWFAVPAYVKDVQKLSDDPDAQIDPTVIRTTAKVQK